MIIYDGWCVFSYYFDVDVVYYQMFISKKKLRVASSELFCIDGLVIFSFCRDVDVVDVFIYIYSHIKSQSIK